MSISPFFTSQNSTGAASLASGAAGGAGQGTGGGVDFMEFLLALATKNEKETTETEDTLALDLDVAELLSATPEIEEDLKQLTETLDLTLEEQVEMALSLNQRAFDKLSAPDEFTQETHEIILEKKALEAELQAVSEHKDILNALLAGLQSLENVESFDLSRLTPQQFANLQAEIEVQIAEDNDDAAARQNGLSAAFAQLLNIANTPAAATQTISALPASLTKDGVLAQRLKALQVGGTALVDAGDTAAFKQADGDLSEFDLLLKKLDTQSKGAQPDEILSQLKKLSPDGSSTHALPSLPSLLTGGAENLLTIPAGAFDQYIEQFTAAHSSLNALQSVGGTLAQGQSAGQNTQATQLVAITMQKLGADGKDRTFTLRLSPDTLGRVEVRLNFGKDKAMKALLVIEKPETFAMLQRDAQALERAIQDIGLNADGGLSFEMAQDGHDFNQDGRHDGTRNNASGGQGDDTEENLDLIESTMTWQVDPETGHMRYDILA